MAARSRFETFNVLPRDHESLPPSTKYDVSDIDLQIPGNHTTPCIVYPFDGDKSSVVANLQAGLANALTYIPLLGAELLNEDGRLRVLRNNHQPLGLHVHHLDEDPDFPSYQELAAKGFPASFFSDNREHLTPPGSNLAGFRRDDGCPVAVFQANFIKGGVIIIVAVNHICGDAKSIDHTYKLWAASTLAAANKSPMPEFHPVLDRTYFNASSAPLSEEDLQAKKAKVRGFTFHPIAPAAPAEADTKAEGADPPTPPPMVNVMYHFSADSCKKLKSICSPGPQSSVDVSFVSSYDVVAGLTWRAMTRARIPYLDLDVSTETVEYAHPIDCRGRFNGSEVPLEYFGNGFTMMPTSPITIAELVEEAGLAKAAQLIRRATEDFGPQTIPDMLAVQRGIQGREEMRWEWQRKHVVGTAWNGMHVYTYDFGFGLPVSVRLPVPPFEGVLGVLPANQLGSETGGYDVYVVLDEGSQQRLRDDPEFAKYCSVIEA
jgi:hypothetical protein